MDEESSQQSQSGPISLMEFMTQLEDYNPTIPDAVTLHFLHTSGIDCNDPRIIRIISVAAQKFISDIANDSLQHCKMRSSNATTSHSSSKGKTTKDRRYTLTLEDVVPALAEYGIVVKKPHYYV